MSAEQVSFAEVKQAVSMEMILGHYGLLGGLARKGKDLTGRCPFCKGKSERQFRASPEKNVWYCFGCRLGGNVLDFVARSEKASLRAAALAIDGWFELGLSTVVAISRPEATQPAALAEPTGPVAPNEPLCFGLKTLDPAHPSLVALGLSERTIEIFGLGFCAKGLLRDRIAIPIHDRAGALVAYAGLLPEDRAGERYLFPPKFHRNLEVFNLHRFPEAYEAEGPVILAADILGALRLADAGISRLLGLFDGVLSEAQLGALSDILPMGSRLILAGDEFEPSTIARLSSWFWTRCLSFEASLAPEAHTTA